MYVYIYIQQLSIKEHLPYTDTSVLNKKLETLPNEHLQQRIYVNLFYLANYLQIVECFTVINTILENIL